MPRRGRGQVVCYNYNQEGHLARYCQNLTTTCRYCRAVDHVIEQCPQLIAKIQERNNKPSQNVQMIAVEQRLVPAINVVTRSGATTQVPSKEKQFDEAWVCKAPEKVPAFNIGREKETFLESRKDLSQPLMLLQGVELRHNCRIRGSSLTKLDSARP